MHASWIMHFGYLNIYLICYHGTYLNLMLHKYQVTWRHVLIIFFHRINFGPTQLYSVLRYAWLTMHSGSLYILFWIFDYYSPNGNVLKSKFSLKVKLFQILLISTTHWPCEFQALTMFKWVKHNTMGLQSVWISDNRSTVIHFWGVSQQLF